MGLYGTRIEVVTHCWLVSLEGACGVGRVQFRAGVLVDLVLYLLSRSPLVPVAVYLRTLRGVGFLLKL